MTPGPLTLTGGLFPKRPRFLRGPGANLQLHGDCASLLSPPQSSQVVWVPTGLQQGDQRSARKGPLCGAALGQKYTVLRHPILCDPLALPTGTAHHLLPAERSLSSLAPKPLAPAQEVPKGHKPGQEAGFGGTGLCRPS